METNIISRPAIIVVPSVSQFARGSINLVPLTSKLLAIFSADFLSKSFVQVCAWINQLCVCGKWQCRRRPSFSHSSSSSSLKPQIVEISQNLLLMLLPNASLSTCWPKVHLRNHSFVLEERRRCQKPDHFSCHQAAGQAGMAGRGTTSGVVKKLWRRRFHRILNAD